MKNHIAIILQTIILLALIFGWAIRLEVSIAKIQTDVVWIKKELNRCQPN